VCYDRDSNPTPPEYKARALLIHEAVLALIFLVKTLADFLIKIIYTYLVSPLNSICRIRTSRILHPLSCSRLTYTTLARIQYICLACPLKLSFLSMVLKPFGPRSVFQVLNPMHSQLDSLDGGSARRKAATYIQNNTNRINA
jgi:hypothetical protein